VLTAIAAFVTWAGLRMDHDNAPFGATIVLFLLGFAGLVISSFPYLVPPSLTIWQTAAVPASQSFMLVGTLVLLPVILAYTAYVYWLFRGKVGPGQGYHH
jgi:cytochrome d ubiquinol oxidase subunit II